MTETGLHLTLPKEPTIGDLLQDVQDLLSYGKVAVLTGAGISAESGIPTYRDHDLKVAEKPLWDTVDPREMATPRAFRKNRNRVWRWYMRRIAEMRGAGPADGHYLLEILRKINPDVQVFTQNVDGLHERAGTPTGRLHGSVQHYRCRCGHAGMVPELETLRHGWPYCESCGSSRTRPDVVWFGENLPEGVYSDAYDAFEQADIKLVIGTSAIVYPVGLLPLLGKGLIVEVNPEETPLTKYSALSLASGAGPGMRALLNA